MKSNLKSLFLTFLIMTMFVLLLGTASFGLEKVRIGIIPYQDSYPFILADHLGYYEEEGIEPVFEQLLFFPDVHEALAANALDIGPTESAVYVAAYKSYPDLVMAFPFHVFHHGFSIMIKPDSDLKSYQEILSEVGDPNKALELTGAQLKSKTGIAMRGTDQEMPIWSLAKIAGLDLDNDINMIDMQPDEGVTAFIAGTGDFFAGGIPQRMAALKNGMKEMITVADIGGGVVCAPMMAVTKKYAEENWDTLVKLFHIYIKTCQYMSVHLNEAAEFISGELNKNTAAGMTPQDFIDIFDKWQAFPSSLVEWGYWIGPIEGNLSVESSWLTGKLPRYSQTERWEKVNDYLIERGMIQERVPIEGHFIYDQLFLDVLDKYGPKG
ncbi:MAG: ABC transporter substrate-binding protein [Atribacterota bacterium]|nr:ABC transporter substrate-binding protein [Atribacterota bacterium]